MNVTLSGVFLFFFKQKTAYEMRISDWSSDVCSSDLSGDCARYGQKCNEGTRTLPGLRLFFCHAPSLPCFAMGRQTYRYGNIVPKWHLDNLPLTIACGSSTNFVDRSEEHTSELQSRMRTSYAVFCV